MNIIFTGTLASLIAGSATILGAALVFPMRKVSEKFLDAAMGFSAGVMLAASFFGLIAPAIRIGNVWKADPEKVLIALANDYQPSQKPGR